MPIDKHGKDLAVGDKVMIPATVVDIYHESDPSGQYVNVRVELDHIMPPYTEKSLYDLNSTQVVKQSDPN
jgi:hypothetical protein